MVGGPLELRPLERRRDPAAAVASEHGREPVLEAVRLGGKDFEARVPDDTVTVERDESDRARPRLRLQPLVERARLGDLRERDLRDALDGDRVRSAEVLLLELDDPGSELTVAGRDLEQDRDVAPHLFEASVPREGERALVVLGDAAPHRLPAEAARVLGGSGEQCRADSTAPRLGADAHHRVGAARDARGRDVDVAAGAVQEQNAVGAGDLPRGDRIVRVDLVLDRRAELEVLARSGEPNHSGSSATIVRLSLRVT